MDDKSLEARSPEHQADEMPVLYEVHGKVAVITLNRPQFGNAQNHHMLYELDEAYLRASNDDDIGAIVLCGAGKHFSSGHDTGTPGQMNAREKIQRKSMWYSAGGKPDAERLYVQEQEVYLSLCRRMQATPKPTVGAVQGACIAGGLMLAWTCDIIVASDDAYFMDPVVSWGIPGVEYFAHAHEMQTRIAREFLMLGEKFSAQRAYEVGMVNRVVPRTNLNESALEIARRLAERPRFALALTKQALNLIDDLKGRRTAMEAVYPMHQLAHAHNIQVTGSSMLNFNKKK